MEVEMPPEVLLVPMDGILIEQVLVNLMENAMLHGETTKKVRIVVLCSAQRVDFSVEDDGGGIRESVLPHIFDENLQSREGKTYDSKKNMGIGLSVCMSIVRAHKGNMTAKNLDGGGACVTFWLPREEEI